MNCLLFSKRQHSAFYLKNFLFKNIIRGANCANYCRLIKSEEFGVYKVSSKISATPHPHGRSVKNEKKIVSYLVEKIKFISVLLKRFGFINMSDSSNTKFFEKSAADAKVRGMKVLDRSLFCYDIRVFGLAIPNKSVSSVSKRFKDAMIKMPKVKAIAELNESDSVSKTHKRFLFNPSKHCSHETFTDSDKEFLLKLSVDVETGKTYDLRLSYENWTYDEVLDAVLPENTDGVGGFSLVGHIAHLNLRDELLEYKDIIGTVLLDKVYTVKTVVNKLHTIDNTYRFFQMEVLAGEHNFVTTTKEHGCSFEFDFSKVYWNSRLATEHKRIVELLNKGDVLYDVFAGVGPFAVPAAKKKCIVFANDLNPESYKWLVHNMTLNKVSSETSAFNLDGRDFIRSVVKSDILKRSKVQDGPVNRKFHIVMNLPAIAIEFLDSFKGLISDVDLNESGLSKEDVPLPVIHCYCFSKSDDVIKDARCRTEAVLGGELPQSTKIRIVRNVAPSKEMLCVSFEIPCDILISQEGTDEPLKKKQKISCNVPE